MNYTITPEEFTIALRHEFNRMDKDQDGRLARAELKRLRSRLEDLSDYVDLLEARRQNAGKPTFSTEEVLRRLHLRRLHSLSQ